MTPLADRPLGMVHRIPAAGRVAAVAVGATAVVTALAVVDPNQPGHYPVCPTYALFGLYCPGCGALRSVHDLAVGDVGSAWSMNPLAVLAVPYLIWAWVAWARRVITGKPRAFLAPGWVPLTVGVVIVAFGVLRNVPGLEFLAPH